MMAVLYARVSPGEHARKGYSIDEQLRACREKAAALAAGQQVTLQEFTDVETSGDIDPLDRPGFAQALRAAREQKAAWFVCLDPDRFSRDTYQALGAAQDVDATGARLEFVQHEYGRGPEAQLFFTLRVAIAQFEKSQILRRTRRGVQGKLARGTLPWAPRPYGYRFDKETDTLFVVPEQARWVRQMYRWVVEERIGPLLIARRLNELGVRPPRSNWWYKQRIGPMLRNPVYRGELVVNKTDQRGMRRNRYLPADRKARKRPKPASEWVTIRVPAVVDPATWEHAQEILADNRRKRPGGPLTPYLLTGVCVCGVCGRPCHGFSNGQGRRYYVCAGRHPAMKYPDPRRHAHSRCCLPHLRADAVEGHVLPTVKRWISNFEQYLAMRSEALKDVRGDPSDELTRLRRIIAELEAEWDRRVEAFQLGLVRDAARAQADIAEIRDRVLALRRREDAVAMEAAPHELDAVAHAGDMEESLAAFGPEEWKAAVRFTMARVVLFADGPPLVVPR